jgi:hypothetical protein
MIWRNLDRHFASKPRIARAIHLTHPSRTERGEDFVGPKASASTQSHVGLDYTPRNINGCYQ